MGQRSVGAIVGLSVLGKGTQSVLHGGGGDADEPSTLETREFPQLTALWIYRLLGYLLAVQYRRSGVEVRPEC